MHASEEEDLAIFATTETGGGIVEDCSIDLRLRSLEESSSLLFAFATGGGVIVRAKLERSLVAIPRNRNLEMYYRLKF